MKLKRIVTIIIALLILAGLLFVASWYVARKNAEKNGATPLSFKEFLGIGNPALPGSMLDGELNGEFTGPQKTIKYDNNNNGVNDWLEDMNNNGVLDGNEDNNNDGVLDGDEDTDNDGTRNRDDTYVESTINDIDGTVIGSTSTTNPDGTVTNPDGTITNPGNGGNPEAGENPGGFDGEPFTPEGGNPGAGGNPGDNNNPGSAGNPGDNNNPNDGPGAGGSTNGGDTTISGGDNGYGDINDVPDSNPAERFNQRGVLQCSEDDMNIQFTTEELAQLRALQTRFNTIAEGLYEQDSVAEQKSLYSSLKIKSDDIKGLVLFCENNSPNITDPKMKRKIPTPFYRGTQDNGTYTSNTSYTSEDNNSMPSNRKPLLNFPINATTLFERLLRINIW